MNRKPILGASAALIALVAFVYMAQLYIVNGSNGENENAIFTVNGTPVSTDEFNLFFQNNKALTANYFKTKYNTDYSSTFWDSSYNGETPSDYAKQKALDELKKYKIEQLIMKENKIIEDLSFDHFMENLQAENNNRRKKMDNKEPIYGLTQFSAMQYYSYLHSTHYANLINSLLKSNAYLLDDAVYQDYYERNKQFYSKGFKLEGQLFTTASPAYETIFKTIQDGKPDSSGSIVIEQLSLDPQSISKDELTKRSLYETAIRLNENEFSQMFPYNNGNAIFKLTTKQSLGYKSFADVKSDVKKLYINDKIQQQISDRLKSAKVVINHSAYDAVRMK